MHAKALTDPLFKTKVAEGNAATGGQIGPFCLKCHGPVGTMTNQLANTDPKSAGAQGIPCSFCHQVTGASAPTNNVSLMVDPSGTYRAQLATPTAPHAVAPSPFHTTSAICGSCHNVSHPGNGLPVEATYTEWQGSPQAKAGVQCQDCHMSAAPGQIGPSMGWAAGGGPQRMVYQMNFMGAQVALGNSLLAEQMLKSAATLEMVSPGILEGSKNTSVAVTVTNTGAGHNLPTGLTELREMWLQVTFVAPDGKETEVGKHVYGTVLKDAAGKYPAEMWTATGIQSDDRIPPKGTSESSYKFAFPAGVEYGTIKAQLLYRSAPEALAKKAGVENPVTVMAEKSQPVYLNTAAERASHGAELAEASTSPLTPLVIAIAGMVLCAGLIIFFLMWNRGPAAPVGPKPDKKAKAADEDKAAKKADAAKAADKAEPTADAAAGEDAE
jgi:hypothetical protein